MKSMRITKKILSKFYGEHDRGRGDLFKRTKKGMVII